MWKDRGNNDYGCFISVIKVTKNGNRRTVPGHQHYHHHRQHPINHQNNPKFELYHPEKTFVLRCQAVNQQVQIIRNLTVFRIK